MILPNTSPCLEGSTERSDGSLGRSLRTAAMVTRDTEIVNRQPHVALPGRQYLEWIQVSDMILPNTSPCLEGSTERSDGSLGRSLRKIAMVAQITDMANR